MMRLIVLSQLIFICCQILNITNYQPRHIFFSCQFFTGEVCVSVCVFLCVCVHICACTCEHTWTNVCFFSSKVLDSRTLILKLGRIPKTENSAQNATRDYKHVGRQIDIISTFRELGEVLYLAKVGNIHLTPFIYLIKKKKSKRKAAAFFYLILSIYIRVKLVKLKKTVLAVSILCHSLE